MKRSLAAIATLRDFILTTLRAAPTGIGTCANEGGRPENRDLQNTVTKYVPVIPSGLEKSAVRPARAEKQVSRIRSK
jgi:hypothetical protein